MKKIVLIAGLAIFAAFLYIALRPDSKQTVSYNRTDDGASHPAPKLNEAAQPKNINQPQALNNPSSSPNSGNRSPETGWSAFPGASERQPSIDVSAQINVGNGSIEPKTITAKQGQRVSIMFTASIRDLVSIQGYDVETYIEPMRESTVGFTVNTTGQFDIKLVKSQKTIGRLIVN